jgi:hypothetical protein
MTSEIDLNPHSFVVFMTMAAGVSYIFFSSRTGFGGVKLMIVLLFVIPSVMIGNSIGHSVDMVVGTVIGCLTAKRVQFFNPFARIRDYFGINKLNERLKERERRARDESQYQSTQEEAARRQEQAKHKRESRQENQRSKSSRANRSQDSYSDTRNDTQKSKVKTDLEKAYEVLGLQSTASYADTKRARGKLMSLYHPDKLAGLPEGRLKKAENEAKRINIAWNFIKRTNL